MARFRSQTGAPWEKSLKMSLVTCCNSFPSAGSIPKTKHRKCRVPDGDILQKNRNETLTVTYFTLMLFKMFLNALTVVEDLLNAIIFDAKLNLPSLSQPV